MGQFAISSDDRYEVRLERNDADRDRVRFHLVGRHGDLVGSFGLDLCDATVFGIENFSDHLSEFFSDSSDCDRFSDGDIPERVCAICFENDSHYGLSHLRDLGEFWPSPLGWE